RAPRPPGALPQRSRNGLRRFGRGRTSRRLSPTTGRHCRSPDHGRPSSTRPRKGAGRCGCKERAGPGCSTARRGRTPVLGGHRSRRISPGGGGIWSLGVVVTARGVVLVVVRKADAPPEGRHESGVVADERLLAGLLRRVAELRGEVGLTTALRQL